MAAAIALRGDCDSGLLRELAKQSEDADQVRRLLALAVVYGGGSRSDGARAGGVGLQTFRDWVLRLNAAGPESGESLCAGAAIGTGIRHSLAVGYDFGTTRIVDGDWQSAGDNPAHPRPQAAGVSAAAHQNLLLGRRHQQYWVGRRPSSAVPA